MIPVTPSAVGDPSPAGDAALTEQRHATQPDTSKHVHQAVGMERGAEDNPMCSLAKESSHTPPQLSQIQPQPGVEMGTVPVPGPLPEDAMEVNALCEETVYPPDMEVFFDAAGEFFDRYTGEILDRDATVAGIRAELTQMQEFGVFEGSYTSACVTRCVSCWLERGVWVKPPKDLRLNDSWLWYVVKASSLRNDRIEQGIPRGGT